MARPPNRMRPGCRRSLLVGVNPFTDHHGDFESASTLQLAQKLLPDSIVRAGVAMTATLPRTRLGPVAADERVLPHHSGRGVPFWIPVSGLLVRFEHGRFIRG